MQKNNLCLLVLISLLQTVRLDIINTVGVTEDSQKTIKCDAEIFVVVGIWAGYDKEPVSDLSSYSCSEWDETTAYFMEQCNYKNNCEVTASSSTVFSSSEPNCGGSVGRRLILRFLCSATFDKIGFITTETRTILSSTASFPSTGFYPWYHDSFVMRLSESGANIVSVKRAAMLKTGDGRCYVLLSWNKTAYSVSIYDEVTEQTTVCSKGQVEPTDMKDNSAAWILVVTNLDSDTEYLVYDSNSGKVVIKSAETVCLFHGKVVGYKLKYQENANGMSVHFSKTSAECEY